MTQRPQAPAVPVKWTHIIVVLLCVVMLDRVYSAILGVEPERIRAAGSQQEVSDAGEGKLAFFITLHEEGVPVPQFERLLSAIYYPQHWYAVHVDSRSGEAYHQQIQAAVDRVGRHGQSQVNVIKMESIQMGWGSFFIMQQTLEAIRVLQLMGPWQHFINLSGSDYVARPIPALVDFLGQRQGTNFIKFGVFPRSLDERVSRMYLAAHDRPMVDTGYPRTEAARAVVSRLDPYPDVIARWGLPTGFKLYKSPAWFVLSRAFCAYVTERMVELIPLVVWSVNVAASDEVFFQTVLFNSPFKNTTPLGDVGLPQHSSCGHIENDECGVDLRYIRFPPLSLHPKVLNMDDYDDIRAKNTIFLLRKVSSKDASSVSLLDRLDRDGGEFYWSPPSAVDLF